MPTTNDPAITPKLRKHHVVFVVYDDIQPLDLFGPYQVFVLANRQGAKPGYRLTVVSRSAKPVSTDCGPEISVGNELNIKGPVDTLIVPGGRGIESALRSSPLVAGIKELAARSQRVCSVCTGAYLLAKAGCLSGRRATTHWRKIEDFGKRFPDIEILPDPIFVNDGNLWTSAGVTAGIDLSLALLADDHGPELSSIVASDLVVYLRRTSIDIQSSAPMKVQSRNNSQARYDQLMNSCLSRLHEKWPVEKMARTVGQSVRTFQRNFREKFDVTPSVWVEQLRVRQATTMLMTSHAKQQDIAVLCGFSSEEHMRVAFQRQQGKTPGAVRNG